MYFDVLSFWYAFPWKLVAPCSRVLWRDHINPRILEALWGKTPIGEIKHGIIIILWFCKNWRTLGRVLVFSPRILWYEVPNHQFKCCEVGLDEFHVGFDELL